MTVVKVVCLICNRPMYHERSLAQVTHIYDDGSVSNTILIKCICRTPDCGNEVVVEDN